MISSLKNASSESINVRFDLRISNSIWTALHENYEGTNITNTIIRLLNMYQPENGVGAYEGLLRTLGVLLEDFGHNNLRSLVSMIPLPKGSSKKIIDETFFNATGFTRIDDSHDCQNNPCFVNKKKSIQHEKLKEGNNEDLKHSETDNNHFINSKTVFNSNFVDQMMKSPEKHFDDCHLFQKLPTTVPAHSHIKDTHNLPYLNHDKYQSYQYFTKHQTGSLYLSSLNCEKNWPPNQTHLLTKNCNPVQTNFPYHNMLLKTADNKYLQLPITTYNASSIHYLNHPYQNQKTYLKEKNIANIHDSSNNISQAEVSSVSDDTDYKNEESKKNETLNKLAHSNFKKRNMNFFNQENVKKNDDEIKNNQFLVSYEDSLLETLTINKNLKSCIENFLKRLKQNLSLNDKKTSIKNLGTLICILNPSSINCKKIIDLPFIEYENNDLSNLKTNNNNLMDETNLISELTTNKRQYYDALLSVQRAKMAVAKSLTLPLASNYDNYNPYYMDYSQQYHWPISGPQETTIHQSLDCQKFIYPQYSHFYNSEVYSTNWNPSYFSSKISQKNLQVPCSQPTSINGSHFVHNFSNNASQYLIKNEISSQKNVN